MASADGGVFSGYLELVHLIYARNSADTSETSDLDAAAANTTHTSTTIDHKCRGDDTVLRIACDKGDLKLVETLLRSSSDVDTPDYRGWTPLMTAAGRGHADIMLLLIQRGAFINRQNRYGGTALQFACLSGKLNAVRILIRHGAAVDLANHKDWSPLMLALQAEEQVAVVEYLLGMGVSVDQKGPDGATALHFASTTGQINAICRLLDRGATIDLRNDNGDTPLMLAVANNNRLTVKVLVERDARTDAVKLC